MNCNLCGEPTGSHDVAPVCQRCRSSVGRTLAELPELYVRAHMELSRAAQLTERISTGPPGSRAPVREGLLQTSDQLVRLLAAWEFFTVATAGLALRSPRVRASVLVSRACGLLRAHLGTALSVPDAAWYAAMCATAHGSLRTQLGMRLLVHRLTAPCPHCDMRALTRADGDDFVACGMCGASWPERHYPLLVRGIVADWTP